MTHDRRIFNKSSDFTRMRKFQFRIGAFCRSKLCVSSAGTGVTTANVPYADKGRQLCQLWKKNTSLLSFHKEEKECEFIGVACLCQPSGPEKCYSKSVKWELQLSVITVIIKFRVACSLFVITRRWLTSFTPLIDWLMNMCVSGVRFGAA